MKTTNVVLAAVAATACVGAGLVLTASDAAPSAPRSGTFTLVSHHGSESSIDLGPDGFSAGDQDLFTSPVTYRGHAAGHLVGQCTTVRVGASSADQLCTFDLRLRHGEITAAGPVHAGAQGPGTFVLPVLGGTGRYVGATGTVAVTASSGSTVPIKVSLRR